MLYYCQGEDKNKEIDSIENCVVCECGDYAFKKQILSPYRIIELDGNAKLIKKMLEDVKK